jgi:hypothetical protein
MLTLDRKQQPVALREWRRFEPAFLAGVLFAGLAVVPLTAGTPFTPMRVLGLGTLLAAALGLMLAGRPRSRRRALPSRVPASLGAREHHAALELEGSPLPPTYRALLVLEDGSRHVVLERNEPAGVLEDASLLARSLGVTLVPGWGLDEAALDALVHPSEHAAPRFDGAAPFRFESPPLPAQRAAAWTTLWACAFVLVATIAMSDAARSRVTPGALSLTLPGVSVLLVLVLWLWLVGLRGELELRPTSITRRQFWFRFELGHAERRELAVAAAVFVAPSGAPVGHLVVSNGTNLFAFPLRGGSPELARLHQTLAARRTNRAAE